MQNALLRKYRKNPERFREILEISRHSHMDRSDLIKLLRQEEPRRQIIQPALMGIAGAVLGSVLGVSISAGFIYLSETIDFSKSGVWREVLGSLVPLGILVPPLAGLFLGGTAGTELYCSSKERQYKKLKEEAMKNGYDPEYHIRQKGDREYIDLQSAIDNGYACGSD